MADRSIWRPAGGTLARLRRAVLLAATATILSSCGDDLESRNAAVMKGAERAEEVKRNVESTPRSARDTSGSVDAEQDDASPEVVEEEVAPESFIDDARGFSTDPIDDTAGFDPSPMFPEGVDTNPEPYE